MPIAMIVGTWAKKDSEMGLMGCAYMVNICKTYMVFLPWDKEFHGFY